MLKLRIDITEIYWKHIRCFNEIFFYLSSNPNAISLLEKNQNKIDWTILSNNKNAIDILKANQDKIDWYWLSANPNAIELTT